MPEWDEDESIATDDEDNEVGAENGDNCRIIDRDRMTEYEFNDDYRKRNGWMVSCLACLSFLCSCLYVSDGFLQHHIYNNNSSLILFYPNLCDSRTQGTDLCHSARYSPVRISHYTVKYSNKHHNHQQGGGGVGTTLTGLCHYTQQSESHAGYCHGGSMTAAIDDVVGWTAFNVLGKCEPWSGYTVQVNVALKRPIPVGSYLKIVGEITKFEGRKVWVHAKLVVPDDDEDGEDKEVLHCDAEGLVLLKKDVVTSSPIFHTP